LALPDTGTVAIGSLSVIRPGWLSAGWSGAQFYVYRSLLLEDGDEWLTEVNEITKGLTLVGSVELEDEKMYFGTGVLTAYREKEHAA